MSSCAHRSMSPYNVIPYCSTYTDCRVPQSGRHSPAASEHTLPHPVSTLGDVASKGQHRCEDQERKTDDAYYETPSEWGGHRDLVQGGARVNVVQSLLQLVNLE